mgnify:CR=1 FL=1
MDLTTAQKGRRAKEILDDPVFHEAIDVIRSDIITHWNLTLYDQTDKREGAYHRTRALDEILRELRTLVADWTVDQSRNRTKKGRK